MPRASQLLPPGTPATRAAAIRQWLTGTFSGVAIGGGALIKLLAFLLTLAAGRSRALEALDTVGDLALVVGAFVLGYGLYIDVKRKLLWRVRRKLTLSYIFIGFVPALLIITFFLLLGMLIAYNVSGHLINTRIMELQGQTSLLAQMAAVSVEQARTEVEFLDAVARRQAVAAMPYPGVSYAIVPARNPCGGRSGEKLPFREVVRAGPWAHASPPQSVPSWIKCEGYAGVAVYTDASRPGSRTVDRLMTRAAAWPSDGSNFVAIVDVPVVAEMAGRFRAETGIELVDAAIVEEGPDVPVQSEPQAGSNIADALSTPEGGGLFRRRFGWVTLVDSTDWETGTGGSVAVGIRSSLADLYESIAPQDRLGRSGYVFGGLLLVLVAVVGVMFLVIQLVAFGMGLGLARSITGAVHELFEGTERVRAGDFSGQISVRSRDQMGQLAESFNEMTASIEVLLQEKAEKERLEQELLIARRIQMSLLPQGPAQMPGLTLTAHCEPAREVGGDYYDFLPIDEYTIGVLIADVSGKGTSAALYMAELKGIILSLSQRHTSPRELLIEADRIISRHLDSRSFITVSYLLVDLRSRTVRYARAGHCPMIYMPGPYSSSRAPELLTPDGLVLGLQLDEGRTFTRLLEEVTLPLGPGDLFVLYTDGMSEAMNPHGDCFGDARLADVIGAHADLPAEQLRDRILRDLDAFAGSAAQHDDMTMVLLRVDEMAAA